MRYVILHIAVVDVNADVDVVAVVIFINHSDFLLWSQASCPKTRYQEKKKIYCKNDDNPSAMQNNTW